MIKKFEVSSREKSMSEILQFTQSSLKKFRMDSKAENRVILMVEESLNVLLNHVDISKSSQTLKLSLRKFLDSMKIEISVPGEEFIFANENLLSPKLESLDTDSDSSEEVNTAIQNLLLSSFGDSLKYKHKNGVNSVRIEAVKSPYSFLYKTLGAVFLVVILGIICRYFVPENIYTALNDNILTSCQVRYSAINVSWNIMRSCSRSYRGLFKVSEGLFQRVKQFIHEDDINADEIYSNCCPVFDMVNASDCRCKAAALVNQRNNNSPGRNGFYIAD